jgi:hypothetical protein
MSIKYFLSYLFVFLFNYLTLYFGTDIYCKKKIKMWNPIHFIFFRNKFPIIYKVYFFINILLFSIGIVSLFFEFDEIQKKVLQIMGILYFIILGTNGIYMSIVKGK